MPDSIVSVENDARATFMLKHQLSKATWDELTGVLVHAERSPATYAQAPAAPVVPRAAPPPQETSLEKLRAKLLEKRQRDHEIRFAHSHHKPPFSEPEPMKSDVPRAVRAREAARAKQRTPPKRK